MGIDFLFGITGQEGAPFEMFLYLKKRGVYMRILCDYFRLIIRLGKHFGVKLLCFLWPVCRYSVVFMAGIVLTGILMMVFDGPEGGGRTTLTAYAKASPEALPSQELETYMETGALKEGQLLAGETLAREISAREKAWEERKERIEQMQAVSEKTKAQESGRESGKGAEKETETEFSKENTERKEQEKPAQASAVVGCSARDYEVLKRIVEAEAGICDLKGRILVANVVINRVKSSKFPNSITDVVYQKSQFSPVSNGTLDSCTVTPETVDAVNRALAGEDYSQGALYFMNRNRSRSGSVSWFDKSLTYLFRHDRHEFFR